MESSHFTQFIELVERSVMLRASDIHLSGGCPPYYRIDAQMQPLDDEQYSSPGQNVLAPDVVEGMAQALMTPQQRQVFQKQQTLDIAFTAPSKNRFRVNIYRARQQTALAIRRLDDRFRTIDDLHLPPQLDELAEFPHGLVLVTGATGSGKSTTLAALIHRINCERRCHIVTIEDPVEYIHQNRCSLVHQRELHTDVASFADAVRAALREDPDVLLVGEMRDVETMRAAITAAETGHLVFSTLHTGDAVGAVDRMISVFPAEEQACIREQLSRVLRAVVAQRLVKRCDGPGRVPAVEVMRVNNAVANQIRLGEPHQIYSVMQTATQDGMVLLEQSLAELVFQGLIDQNDAFRLARDLNVFDSRLKMERARMTASGGLARAGR